MKSMMTIQEAASLWHKLQDIVGKNAFPVLLNKDAFG